MRQEWGARLQDDPEAQEPMRSLGHAFGEADGRRRWFRDWVFRGSRGGGGQKELCRSIPEGVPCCLQCLQPPRSSRWMKPSLEEI